MHTATLCPRRLQAPHSDQDAVALPEAEKVYRDYLPALVIKKEVQVAFTAAASWCIAGTNQRTYHWVDAQYTSCCQSTAQ